MRVTSPAPSALHVPSAGSSRARIGATPCRSARESAARVARRRARRRAVRSVPQRTPRVPRCSRQPIGFEEDLSDVPNRTPSRRVKARPRPHPISRGAPPRPPASPWPSSSRPRPAPRTRSIAGPTRREASTSPGSCGRVPEAAAPGRPWSARRAPSRLQTYGLRPACARLRRPPRRPLPGARRLLRPGRELRIPFVQSGTLMLVQVTLNDHVAGALPDRHRGERHLDPRRHGAPARRAHRRRHAAHLGADGGRASSPSR